MRKVTGFGSIVVLTIALAGCGGSSDGATTSGDTLAATDISQLPKATSPMASTSASISTAPKSVLKSATLGLPLLTASSSSFQQDDSMAACQVANVLKEGIISAAQSDQILCYVQAMSDTFGTVVTNPEDGNWHIYNLNITGESENDQGPSKVKMRIIKTDGHITSFVMHMCNATTQTEYISQTLDGASFTMASRGIYSSSEWSGGYQVDVTGTLNTSGAYTQRTIAMRNSGSNGDTNSYHQEATIVQTPGAFTLSGYQIGNWRDGSGNGTHQEAAYAIGELLNDASTDITTLAIGDGAVKADGAYTFTSSQFGSGSFNPSAEVFAWLGDSMAALDPASGSSFYAIANAGTVPTPAESFTVTFDEEQEWDCSDDVATAVTLPAVSGPEIDAACSQYNQSHDRIDCYSVIGQFENHEQE